MANCISKLGRTLTNTHVIWYALSTQGNVQFERNLMGVFWLVNRPQKSNKSTT